MLALAAALAIGGLACAETTAPTNALPNPYRSIEGWARMPEGRTWGSTSGVAVDPDGNSVWPNFRSLNLKMSDISRLAGHLEF